MTFWPLTRPGSVLEVRFQRVYSPVCVWRRWAEAWLLFNPQLKPPARAVQVFTHRCWAPDDQHVPGRVRFWSGSDQSLLCLDRKSMLTELSSLQAEAGTAKVPQPGTGSEGRRQRPGESAV